MNEMKNCKNCRFYYGQERCGSCFATYNSDTGVSSDPSEWMPVEDSVNHPAHYETGKFECIEVMLEAIGKEAVKDFCLCNAFKYIYRCKNKHESPVEDVEKAVWYLNKFVELSDNKKPTL